MVNFGVTISLLTIILNFFILSLGLRKIDPVVFFENNIPYMIPGALIELTYIIWALINLPSGIFAAIIFIELSGYSLSIFRIEGNKFYQFVMVPLSVNIMIFYGLAFFLENLL